MAQKDDPAEHLAGVARDLEMTKLCAQAMGRSTEDDGGRVLAHLPSDSPFPGCVYEYDPLHDDAQAMALVKQFGLRLGLEVGKWEVWNPLTDQQPDHIVMWGDDLNRAIVECVATMQATGAKPSAGCFDSTLPK